MQPSISSLLQMPSPSVSSFGKPKQGSKSSHPPSPSVSTLSKPTQGSVSSQYSSESTLFSGNTLFSRNNVDSDKFYDLNNNKIVLITKKAHSM